MNAVSAALNRGGIGDGVARDTVEEFDGLTSADLRLIQALQVVPRASWARIGAVLGCDPVTAARRWERLRDGGYAWVTAYDVPRGLVVGLVELTCTPGTVLDVATQVGEDKEAFTIDITAGGRDLLATVALPDEEKLGDYLLTRLGPVPGVVGSRTHVFTRIVGDARSWRLRVLGPDELAALEAIPHPSTRARVALSSEEFDAVLSALADDGRIRASELAERLGIGVDRARTQLNAVLATESVTVRTEVARRHSGSPAYAWFFLRVPARSMDRVLRRLSTLRDVRLLATSVGTCNIVLAMWLAGLEDVQRVEAVIEQSEPEVTVVDRSLVLRTVKHLGRPLTASGRSAR